MAGTSGLAGTPTYLNPVEVTAQQQASAAAHQTLTRDDFFKLLITQLQTQDPLEPMDNDRMLDQIATLQGLETDEQLSSGIKQLVSTLNGSALNQGASLLGKVVTATTKEAVYDGEGNPVVDSDGNPVLKDAPVEGMASGISMQNGKTMLTLEIPIVNSNGEPIYNEEGTLFTKQVTVEMNSVTGISDPLIFGASLEE